MDRMANKKRSRKEKSEGKRVRVEYMKLWVEGKLWIWDEVKNGLRKRRGLKKEKEGTVIRC